MRKSNFKIHLAGLLMVLSACGDDLGPSTKLWNETQTTFGADFAKWKSAADFLQAKVASLGPVEASDAAGQALKAKLDTTLANLKTGLTDADAVLKNGGASVADAVKAGKLAGLQTAIDGVKTQWAAAALKITSNQKAAEAQIEEWNARVAEMKAKAVAADKRAPAGLDFNEVPQVAPQTQGEAEYSGVEFEKGSDALALSKATTKANLTALVSLMNSCPEILVEVEGHTSKLGDEKKNKALSAKRAQAVTRYLINVGRVSPSKIKKTYGFGSQKPAMEEPAPGSPEEKQLEPAKLASIRERNDRIHLRILRPCPAK
jgi:outer membrane protein OmpA-like peptidoglycan-associated protein